MIERITPFSEGPALAGEIKKYLEAVKIFLDDYEKTPLQSSPMLEEADALAAHELWDIYAHIQELETELSEHKRDPVRTEEIRIRFNELRTRANSRLEFMSED